MPISVCVTVDIFLNGFTQMLNMNFLWFPTFSHAKYTYHFSMTKNRNLIYCFLFYFLINCHNRIQSSEKLNEHLHKVNKTQTRKRSGTASPSALADGVGNGAGNLFGSTHKYRPVSLDDYDSLASECLKTEIFCNI